MNSPGLFKRKLLQLGGLWPFMPFGTRAFGAAPDSFRIAFGSCCHQDKPQSIWDAILQDRPDVFVFLGDNVYGDTDDPAVLRACYDKLAAKPGFARLRAQTEFCATWDDHDYGRNDAGREYPMKEESRRIMLDFWNEPAGSERWRQPDGIYTSCFFGPAGQTVQVILLDLRWNRDPVATVSREDYAARDGQAMGPYAVHDDDSMTLLGEAQWRWLEAQLQEKADYRIFASSIQLVAEFTGWETWANFPHERERFLQLLGRHQQVPSLVISGDVHWCELSRLQHPALSMPLLELTSSGLTETWEQISPNRHRVGEAMAVENYGLVTLDWQQVKATLEVKGMEGNVLISTEQALTGIA